ncbi:glycosyltransferase family A protein [Desulfocastanea catecholica]
MYNKNIKYIVVTPVRDEVKYLEKTISSMIAQTILPLEWWIVDDGSSDGTKEIIQKYADSRDWINAVYRVDRGFRKSGGGVIEAFYDAYNRIIIKDYDFIVKLDGDLSFDDDYFEKCFNYFGKDNELGVGGGAVYSLIDGELVSEQDPLFHVRGATKIYKKKCWDEIGGLIKAPGWDTLDEVKANMLGYKTRRFNDLMLTQHKPTGSADGTWKNWYKNGMANYITGYHPLFMFAKCSKRIFQKPYIIMSLALLSGFLGGYFSKTPQVSDKKLIKYLRKEQLKKMLGIKTIWT